MAQTAHPKTPGTATYTVLRPIFMHGQRVEVGDPVVMTPLQYAEANTAGKVGPFVAKPAAPKPGKARAESTTKPPEEATP